MFGIIEVKHINDIINELSLFKKQYLKENIEVEESGNVTNI